VDEATYPTERLSEQIGGCHLEITGVACPRPAKAAPPPTA
jgi:hypothetical protein